MSQKYDLSSLLQNSVLQHKKDELQQLISKNLRLHTTKTDDTSIPMGSSKFGGHPDLPKGVNWFYDGEKPFSFICQINIKDIPHTFSSLLPKEGILFFFYDLNGSFGDYDPLETKGWKVLFHPTTNELERYPSPKDLDEYFQFLSATVTFEIEENLPHPFSATLDLSDEEYDAYWELYEKTDEEDYYEIPNHRMFGHAYHYQDDWRENDSDILLFQIHTDCKLGMTLWGISAGCLYVYISKEDLLALNFDNVYVANTFI